MTSKRIAKKQKKIKKQNSIIVGPKIALDEEEYKENKILEYDVCVPHKSGGLLITLTATMNHGKPYGIWKQYDSSGALYKEFAGKNWQKELQ